MPRGQVEIQREMVRKIEQAWLMLDEVQAMCEPAVFGMGTDRREWRSKVRALRACCLLLVDRLEEIDATEHPVRDGRALAIAGARVLTKYWPSGVPVLSWGEWRAAARERNKVTNARRDRSKAAKEAKSKRVKGETLADRARAMRRRAGVE